MFWRVCVIAAMVSLGCASPSIASTGSAPGKDAEGVFGLSIENDLFNGEDNNYTNGFRFSYFSSEAVPGWLEQGANALPFFARDGNKRWGLAFGQNLYTPDDITIRAPQPNDQPYAGWLYGSATVVSDTGSRLDTLQLTLGVVGPAALGAQTQDFVHSVIGSPDPQGWRYQLKNEPGVVLTYERKWRGIYEFSPFGLGVDVTPSLGASLGNVATNVIGGAVVRLGMDLPADYGPPLIRPSLSGSDFFVPSRRFGWYIFAGVDAKAVARDIFLDGNTFRDSYSVDKKPLVGGLQGGIALTMNDVRLAYTQVARTKEFDGQKSAEQFGAVTLSWRY